jgi:CP family cyanate transporter-like MFS transporter
VSVGPVLGEIQSALGMSASVAGVLTTMPVLCFAVFGATAPWTARVFGVHRVMLAALMLTAASLGVRATVGDEVLFLVVTVPALAGMATANVLMPSLVKQHFPERIGLLTGLYSTAMALGLTLTSVVTVPIAQVTGSWRIGLAAWAVTALVATFPWLGLLRHDVRPDLDRHSSIPTSALVRSPLAWAMAVLFGAQSLQAYSIFGWLAPIFRDAGFSAGQAGLLLGVTTAIGIPIALVMPAVGARLTSQAPLIVALSCCYVVGYLGLLLWPVEGAVAWAVLIGVGTGIFPLVLVLIGLRARTQDGTAALSGFTQSVGYLLAAVGPLSIGALYDATGAFTWPLVLLIGLVAAQVVSGVLVSRERFVEDEVPSARPRVPA